MRTNPFTFSELKVGQIIEFQHIIQKNDIQLFANLCGDHNPLHLKESFAKELGFKSQVVHGMLVASLISRTVGMYFPGQWGVIVSQALNYKHPIYVNIPLKVKSEITEKYSLIQSLEYSTARSKTQKELELSPLQLPYLKKLYPPYIV